MNNEIKESRKLKEEEMLIIRQYQDLIIYVYQLLKKYPTNERHALVSDTKHCLFEGLELLISAKKAYGKNNKLKLLNDFDTKLSCLRIYVRIASKNKYINPRNYRAWSYKITSIGNLLGGWINECLVH